MHRTMLTLPNIFNIRGLLFVVFNTILLTEANLSGTNYIYHSELQGWLKTHYIPATWADALLQCQLEGATLASPLNENFLAAMRNKYEHIHIGIYAPITQGDFFTVEGVKLDRIPVNWARGQPDNHNNNENCLALSKEGTLVDIECYSVFPFICYRGINSNTECGTVDKEYTLSTKTGSCYKFHPVGQFWINAFKICLSEGGYLAIINSEDEANYLKNLFDKYPSKSITGNNTNYASIGFYDQEENGTWKTIFGETLQEAGYSRFGDGQPDKLKDMQFCGAMFRDGTLDDSFCNDTGPFICEKNPRDNAPYIKCKK